MVSRIKSLIASRCDRRASNHPAYKVITSLLVPRCALCDTVHLSPNRLCDDCIASLECHHRQTPSSSDAIVARDSLAHPSADGLPRTQHQSQGTAFIPDVRRLEGLLLSGKSPRPNHSLEVQRNARTHPHYRPLDQRVVSSSDTKLRFRGTDSNTLASASYMRVRPHVATDQCTGPRRCDHTTHPPSSTSKSTALSAPKKPTGATHRHSALSGASAPK